MSAGTCQQHEPFDFAIGEILMMPDGTGFQGHAWTADELLVIGRSFLEPLFHEPPIGPIPEYLAVHLSVHGCVAEYEDQLEQLDRWKAGELDRWLTTRIGKLWRLPGRTYRLRAEEALEGTPRKYRFVLTDEAGSCDGFKAVEY